jgi:putative flippase GtrA
VIAAIERLLSNTLGPERGYAAFRFFCYVSASGTALLVDLTTYRAALTVFPRAAIAAAIGFGFGILTHYTMSTRVLFGDVLQARGATEEAPVLGKFFIAGITGLLVTTLIVWLVADIGGYHPYAAKAVAVVFSFVSVFTVMRFIVLGNFMKRSTAH